jgi:uncharacterized protein YkwD
MGVNYSLNFLIESMFNYRSRLAIGLGIMTLIGGLTACNHLSQTSVASGFTPNSNSANSKAIPLATIKQSVYAQINQYRQSRKLPSLSLNSAISEQATNHSQAMARKQISFSHDGFDRRVQVIGKVIVYSSSAENIAYNQGHSDPAKVAVDGWLKSPSHRRNIEGQFDLTGIGVARNSAGEYYFTQIFIRQR